MKKVALKNFQKLTEKHRLWGNFFSKADWSK